MTVEAPGRHLIAVQMLRGIAALMVVFVHIDTVLLRLNFKPFHSYWLATGVDIFFVISGFIMWTSVEHRAGMSAGSFLRNRIIRIVPLYWLITALIMLVALIAPQTTKNTVVRPGHALASFLFLPARHPLFPQNFWPLAIPGWSLNYEMLFYAVFAAALVFSNGNRLRRFIVIASGIGGILIIARIGRSWFDVMNFYANPMLLEFLVGVLLGIVWRANIVRHSYGYTAAIAAGFTTLWVGTHCPMGFPAVMLGAAAIVGGAIFLPVLPENFLSRLGDASYSLYLTHSITLAALAWAWGEYRVRLDWPLFVISSVVCSVAVAFAMYRYFEVPVTGALKRRRSRVTRVLAADA